MQEVYLACCITVVYVTRPVACVTVNMTLTHVVSHKIMKLIVPSSAKAQIRASWWELHGTQLNDPYPCGKSQDHAADCSL
jgi:hypothetical protein